MAEKCPRTGKLMQSHSEAHNAMEFLRPTDPRQDLLEVFPCPRWASTRTADHWHVGHRDPAADIPRARYRPPQVDPELTQSLADVLPPHLRALADGGAA